MTIVLLVIIHFLDVGNNLALLLYLIPYILIGYDILIEAAEGIKNREPFDENLLMSIATIGAIVLARLKTGEYNEAIAVMLLYQIGELFQDYAVDKSRKDVSALANISPDFANLELDDGNLKKVDPVSVEKGSVIVVKPGERIPIDGIVISGTSSIDTVALTGESIPSAVDIGDTVFSGSVNINGLLKVRTNATFGESTVSKILQLIESASSLKSKSENFITKFAEIYTPIVVLSALLLAILPPIFLIIAGGQPMWMNWIYRALTFLVISCPCALVISIPLSFFAGIGGASKRGILIKGANYIEILSDVKTFVFDKTGTLTKGTFEVAEINPVGISSDELLMYAANAEKYSTHPAAKSIRECYERKNHNQSQVEKMNVEKKTNASNVKEISGHGVVAEIDGKKVGVGNIKLMKKLGADVSDWITGDRSGTFVHVCVDGTYAGFILLSDSIKEQSIACIKELQESNENRVVMLTGDSDIAAREVSNKLGIKEMHSELLPQDKASLVEQFLSEKHSGKLAFTGDGLNDAPVLSMSDIGIAMGGIGSDAAIEAADVVIMDDNPMKINTAIKISKKCMRIVKENIWFAIGIKFVVLLLGAFGIATLWEAVFADVGVTVIAVLNAMRCMRLRREVR